MEFVKTSCLFDLRCRHCKTDLDDGDVYHKLKGIYSFIYNDDYIRYMASMHGWRESFRLRFTKETEVLSSQGNYVICPTCKIIDPLNRNGQNASK